MATITMTNAAKAAPPAPKIYVSNETYNPSTAIMEFKLHVVEETFVGYGVAILTSNLTNSKQLLGTATVAGSGFGVICKINRGSLPGAQNTKSAAVSIDIGVYDGTLDISGLAIPDVETISGDIALVFGPTANYYNGLEDTYVSHTFYKEGTGGGGGA